MEIDINKYVGKKIKLFREKKNITQEELAQQLSVSRQTISRYESGERRIKQDAIFIIADVLGVSINDLFPPAEDNENDKKLKKIALDNGITIEIGKKAPLTANDVLEIQKIMMKELEEQKNSKD